MQQTELHADFPNFWELSKLIAKVLSVPFKPYYEKGKKTKRDPGRMAIGYLPMLSEKENDVSAESFLVDILGKNERTRGIGRDSVKSFLMAYCKLINENEGKSDIDIKIIVAEFVAHLIGESRLDDCRQTFETLFLPNRLNETIVDSLMNGDYMGDERYKTIAFALPFMVSRKRKVWFNSVLVKCGQAGGNVEDFRNPILELGANFEFCPREISERQKELAKKMHISLDLLHKNPIAKKIVAAVAKFDFRKMEKLRPLFKKINWPAVVEIVTTKGFVEKLRSNFIGLNGLTPKEENIKFQLDVASVDWNEFFSKDNLKPCIDSFQIYDFYCEDVLKSFIMENKDKLNDISGEQIQIMMELAFFVYNEIKPLNAPSKKVDITITNSKYDSLKTEEAQ